MGLTCTCPPVVTSRSCPLVPCARRDNRPRAELAQPWFTRQMRLGQRTIWEWRCSLRYPGTADCPDCPHLGMIQRARGFEELSEGDWEYWSDIPRDLGIPYRVRTWDEAEAFLRPEVRE